mmetsp:Transcript_12488/g.29362  ORF Transcript_12488/g.29362 Transcript_12488/m.29362 type:complete len:211 (-) Transcript_12488:740-1372(-)
MMSLALIESPIAQSPPSFEGPSIKYRLGPTTASSPPPPPLASYMRSIRGRVDRAPIFDLRCLCCSTGMPSLSSTRTLSVHVGFTMPPFACACTCACTSLPPPSAEPDASAVPSDVAAVPFGGLDTTIMPILSPSFSSSFMKEHTVLCIGIGSLPRFESNSRNQRPSSAVRSWSCRSVSGMPSERRVCVLGNADVISRAPLSCRLCASSPA